MRCRVTRSLVWVLSRQHLRLCPPPSINRDSHSYIPPIHQGSQHIVVEKKKKQREWSCYEARLATLKQKKKKEKNSRAFFWESNYWLQVTFCSMKVSFHLHRKEQICSSAGSVYLWSLCVWFGFWELFRPVLLLSHIMSHVVSPRVLCVCVILWWVEEEGRRKKTVLTSQHCCITSSVTSAMMTIC